MSDLSATPNERGVLSATILASGMAFLIGTSVNIALPAIQKSFSASVTGLQWVVGAQALVLASLLLISGSLGDRFGRKRLFEIGIILFAAASVLSSWSRTITQLIVFQGLLGLASALMIPESLALINASIPSERRGRAIGLWSGFSGGVAAAGPFAAGWLVATFGWQAVYYLNLPIGLLAFLLTWKYVSESRNPDAQRLDWLGTICIVAALLGIAYALMTVPSVGWGNHAVQASLAAGVVALIAFCYVETQVPEPLVPLHIFKSNLVLGANIATIFLYFALYGTIFFLSLNLQQVRGFSPTLAGLATLPTILLITFLSGPAGSQADKRGPRLQMILGPSLVGLGMAWLALAPIVASYWVAIFPGLVLFGVGMAAVIAPLTKSALAVDHKYSGAASGVNNAVSRVAELMAVAILGLVAVSWFSTVLPHRLSSENLTPAQRSAIVVQSGKLAGIQVPDSFSADSKSAATAAVHDSFAASFRLIMGINALLAFLAAIAAAIFIYNPRIDVNPENV